MCNKTGYGGGGYDRSDSPPESPVYRARRSGGTAPAAASDSESDESDHGGDSGDDDENDVGVPRRISPAPSSYARSGSGKAGGGTSLREIKIVDPPKAGSGGGTSGGGITATAAKPKTPSLLDFDDPPASSAPPAELFLPASGSSTFTPFSPFPSSGSGNTVTTTPTSTPPSTFAPFASGSGTQQQPIQPLGPTGQRPPAVQGICVCTVGLIFIYISSYSSSSTTLFNFIPLVLILSEGYILF